MSRRSLLITLMSVEALLWCAVTGVPFFRAMNRIYFNTFGVTVLLPSLGLVVALAIAVYIGHMSRAWQGAVALNLIASLLALALAIIFYRGASDLGVTVLYLMAPLAALGWFGWLLRFVRAELAA